VVEHSTEDYQGYLGCSYATIKSTQQRITRVLVVQYSTFTE